MQEFHEYYNNNQKGSDCAIVAALNASYYLHGKRLIKPGTKEYDKVLKRTGCVAGSAISPEKCYKRLKIRVNNIYKTLYDVNFKDLPLEITLWNAHYGYHSALAINYSKKDEAIQILNFKKETTTEGWIFKQNLAYYVNDLNRYWVARSFEGVK